MTIKNRSNYRNEWKQLGKLFVHAYSICSTECVVFAVYEPSAVCGMHSSITHHDEHGWLGQIGSRPLPADVNEIPVGPTRSAACEAFWAASNEEAYQAILEAFPEAAEGTHRHNGEIEVWG